LGIVEYGSWIDLIVSFATVETSATGVRNPGAAHERARDALAAALFS